MLQSNVTKLSLMLGAVLVGVAALPAKAEILLNGRCHMGQCTQMRFEGKTLLANDGGETLYAITISTRSTPIGEEYTRAFGAAQTKYVYCSRTQPVYASQLNNGEYVGSHLNPGGIPAGFAYEAEILYLVTCHNMVGPNFFSDAMSDRAISLGYSLDLEYGQVRGETLDDVLPR